MPDAFQSAWSWKEKNQCFQERFCARLIAALSSSSNVVYEMFNEGEWYDREKRHRHEQHFLGFFRARCDNLLFSNSDHITRDDPHVDPKLDVVTLHPMDWVGHFSLFEKGFRKKPVRPYLYSEPVPEFDGETPVLDDVCRSVWQTALAGAGWVNQNDTSFGWDRHTAIAARSSARDQAYDIAGHCARFFNHQGIRFWEMTPNGDLSSTGVCLADVGSEYVVYAKAGRPFSVDLSASPNASMTARWYNPHTGHFQPSADVDGGDAATRFTPPMTSDAVLHLKRKER